MVALLVLFTIVGCLVVDSIVMAVRDDKVFMNNIVDEHKIIFAQDGGKSITKK